MVVLIHIAINKHSGKNQTTNSEFQTRSPTTKNAFYHIRLGHSFLFNLEKKKEKKTPFFSLLFQKVQKLFQAK